MRLRTNLARLAPALTGLLAAQHGLAQDPAGGPAPRDVLFPAVAVLALAVSIAALVRTFRDRPARPARPELEYLVRETLDRRLKDVLPHVSRSPSPFELEQRAAELRADLEEHATRLRRRFGPPPQERDGSGDPGDGGRGSSSSADALRLDLADLDGSDRARLTDALEAMSQLGSWVELLRPVVREAAGSGLDVVSAALPEPAGDEWRRAWRTLEDFSARDVPAIRRLLAQLPSGNGEGSGGAGYDAAVLEGVGLLEREPRLPERLKRYLEPFDHPGCLGEVTLALQYLVEAFPIEQLGPARRAEVRKGLAEAVKSVRLEEDFHRLVGRAADGIGLVYRPVPYYKSRLDQSEFAFVREQVSPISLTDRVGFAAATDPSVVVRLERPFFFQSTNNVYYAGHAHVARG